MKIRRRRLTKDPLFFHGFTESRVSECGLPSFHLIEKVKALGSRKRDRMEVERAVEALSKPPNLRSMRSDPDGEEDSDMESGEEVEM